MSPPRRYVHVKDLVSTEPPADLAERDSLMRTELVCIPCLNGEHAGCRHNPDGPAFGRAPQDQPCRCETTGHRLGDGTCSDCRTGERGFSYRRCGKPAKGTWEETDQFTGSFLDRERGTHQVERCGIHLNGLRKRAENDARWRAESAERDAARERASENRQAAEDWARRLRDEHGVGATAVGEHVTVNAENLHALLVRYEGLLRDVGVDYRDVVDGDA